LSLKRRYILKNKRNNIIKRRPIINKSIAWHSQPITWCKLLANKLKSSEKARCKGSKTVRNKAWFSSSYKARWNISKCIFPLKKRGKCSIKWLITRTTRHFLSCFKCLKKRANRNKQKIVIREWPQHKVWKVDAIFTGKPNKPNRQNSEKNKSKEAEIIKS